MVRKFQAERSRLDQVLCRANEQCPIMLEELNGFEDYLTFQPVKIVGKRLLAIAYWIGSLVRSRYEEHWGKGYVCVVISNEGKIIT
jgi:hypothetical protein